MTDQQMQLKKPTLRQRKAAKALIENRSLDKPKSTGEVLESVGYGFGLTNSPQRVTESMGFKQALRELGLTEELITSSLVDDIKAKPAKRIQELKLGAEILGMVSKEEEREKNVNNTYNFLFSTEVQQEIKTIDSKIKQMLTNHEPAQKDQENI